jgi:thiol-disulfide isomerase/thioredoxin
MKKTLLVAFGLGIALTAQAQITFEKGTWAEIKAKAQKEKKMIFIDAYTTWCGPCKMLDAQTFKNEEVGKFHNATYINYKMDMEKGEGPAFAQEFKVAAYPTMLFFSKDGELAHRLVGFLPAEPFLAKSKDANNPDKHYYTLLKRYEKGERKADFVRNFVKVSQDAGMDNASAVAKEFLKTMKKSDWEKPENADIIAMTATSLDSESFQYMEKNKDKFTKEQFQGATYGILDVEFGRIVKEKDEAGKEKLKDLVRKYAPEEAENIIPKIDMYYKQMVGGQAGEPTKTAEGDEDWQSLNEKAWAAYENETDKTKLAEALEIAKRSIAMQENYYNTDTYAHLAYKLGLKEVALKMAEKALELGKTSGEDTSATQALIKKIHEGK